jgi:hypothetical protein
MGFAKARVGQTRKAVLEVMNMQRRQLLKSTAAFSAASVGSTGDRAGAEENHLPHLNL